MPTTNPKIDNSGGFAAVRDELPGEAKKISQSKEKSFSDGEFKQADKNSDGYLSSRELYQFGQSHNGDPAFRTAALIAQYERIGQLSNDGDSKEYKGITRSDLSVLNGTVKTLADDWKQGDAPTEQVSTAKVVLEVLANAEHLEKSSALYGHERGPSPNGTRQGLIGDCYVLASISAVCAREPQIIANALKDRGSKGYYVHFKGRPGDPIAVGPLTDFEKAAYNQPNSFGCFASVIEKALGMLNPQKEGSVFPQQNLVTDTTTTTLFLLTGKQSFDFKLGSKGDFTLEEFEKQMKNVESSQLPCVLTSLKQTMEGSAIAPDHGYAVTAYNPEQKLITLRNPWGAGGPNNDGYRTVPTSFVYKNFEVVTIVDR